MDPQAFEILMKQLTQHFDDDRRAQDAHMILISDMSAKIDKLMAAHWMRKGSGIIISGIISLVVSVIAILLSR